MPTTSGSVQSACCSPIWGRRCCQRLGKVDRSALSHRRGRHDARSMSVARRPSASSTPARRHPRLPRFASRRRSGKPLPHEPRPVLAGEHHGAACRLQPGAGHPGACLRHALHRRSGDRLRDWMGVTPARVLRRDPRRHHSHGLLLSRAGCQGRRSSAAARNARRSGIENLFASLPQIELVLAVGSYAQAWHLGDGGGQIAARDTMRRLAPAPATQAPAARLAAAASVLAQQCLAHATIPGSRPSCCRCCAARCASCYRSLSACSVGENNLLTR